MPYRNHAEALRVTVDALLKLTPSKRGYLAQKLGLASAITERAIEAARDLPGLVRQYRNERDDTAEQLRRARGEMQILMEENDLLRRELAARRENAGRPRLSIAGEH